MVSEIEMPGSQKPAVIPDQKHVYLHRGRGGAGEWPKTDSKDGGLSRRRPQQDRTQVPQDAAQAPADWRLEVCDLLFTQMAVPLLA